MDDRSRAGMDAAMHQRLGQALVRLLQSDIFADQRQGDFVFRGFDPLDEAVPFSEVRFA